MRCPAPYRYSSILDRSSLGLNGLLTKSFIPQAMISLMISFLGEAVTAMIGISLKCLRIFRVQAKPSNNGIWTSIRIRSYFFRDTNSNACRPSTTRSISPPQPVMNRRAILALKHCLPPAGSACSGNAHCSWYHLGRRRRTLCYFTALQADAEMKGRTLAGRTVDENDAAHQLHQPGRDR
jgi:hypothetical protein